MRFSIITPAYVWDERTYELFKQAIESIRNQDFDHTQLEYIIVNDGSPMDLSIPNYPWLRVIDQANLQRMAAGNAGFRAARGEIFCLLDADDAYEPNYLSFVDKVFRENPKYKMINFGCKYVHKHGIITTRGPFIPKRKKKGHEVFGGGNVVKGTFVFKREVYDTLGAFPEGIKTIDVPWYKKTELFWTSPYDFSAYAQAEFPEIQPYFQVKHPDHPAGLPKELGNPFGDDFYLFYKYTRVYHSYPFDVFLYIVHLK